MGKADVTLGVKVKGLKMASVLISHTMWKNFLKGLILLNIDPVKTPYDPSFHLKKNNGNPIDQSEYARIIGSVI